MLSDDDIIGIAVREADHLDATRVHEMKAGKWQATTMLEDSALIRLARAILTAAAERAAPTVPMDADHWAELYRLREDVKGPDGHATWKDAAIAMRAALTVDGRCTFPACACGPDKCIAEDTDSAPGPVSASPVTPAADRGAADGDGRLRQGEEGCTFSYTCNDPAHAALPAVLAHNLRGIANAIRTGGFEKGELASYADMLDGYAALPTARAEPVAWIDPDYKLGAPYGKPTAPVITYPQRDWLPLYYAAPQVARQEPVALLLFCPACGSQHIDREQPEKGWTNPPHRSHECQGCGYVWRPADVPTTGVESLTTRGKVDRSPIPHASPIAAPLPLSLPREPTEGMTTAGFASWMDTVGHDEIPGAQTVTAIWQAMYDAAPGDGILK